MKLGLTSAAQSNLLIEFEVKYLHTIPGRQIFMQQSFLMKILHTANNL